MTTTDVATTLPATTDAAGGAPLVSVRDLTVASAHAELLHGISFDVRAGERVGLIGESGSGKSLTVSAIMGLLPDTLDVTGTIRYEGEADDIVAAREAELCGMRGRAMASVFQEPMTALNPLMKVGAQVAEIMLVHGTVDSRRAADERAVELLAQVHLPDPANLAHAYPHQLSGGQRQRVMLAIAMANRPRLLLCDEPTTALDVTVQAEVLRLVDELVTETGTSLLFITHDIGVVAEVCERVIVMYKGDIVEDGPIDQILTAPQHPYTQALIAASDLSAVDEHGRLRTVASSTGAGATAAAATTERVVAERVAPPRGEHLALTSSDERVVFNEVEGDALIRVRDLVREYKARSGGSLLRKAPPVRGLDGIDFDVADGQRFGIVGESGSGKSTLLRLLSALDVPTSGDVVVSGHSLAHARERQLRQFRKDVQIIFQDPMGSLDPRMRVRDIVGEPLIGVGREERDERVGAQLEAVGLDRDVMHRHPHQFSGGQRQRISIARALVNRPRILVADEAVSALDVSVRAQVLNLISDLVDEYGLTLIFVSHDLGVIRHSCDTVAVLSKGRIVECGPTDAVYDAPKHDYTRRLISATPDIERRVHAR